MTHKKRVIDTAFQTADQRNILVCYIVSIADGTQANLSVEHPLRPVFDKWVMICNAGGQQNFACKNRFVVNDCLEAIVNLGQGCRLTRNNLRSVMHGLRTQSS